jgi:hypothetical protein
MESFMVAGLGVAPRSSPYESDMLLLQHPANIEGFFHEYTHKTLMEAQQGFAPRSNGYEPFMLLLHHRAVTSQPNAS